MREFNERGAVDGLFDEMMALFPDLNPSKKTRSEDGFYVSDENRLILIEGSTIHSLARDSDGSPCWVVNMGLLDNWYDGPYFDMMPLSDEIIDEMGLASLNIRHAWELRPEDPPEQDSFLGLLASLSGEDAAYLGAIREKADLELRVWRTAHPDMQDLLNRTGTEVGELDALRRLGRFFYSSDSEFGEAPSCWITAVLGEKPNMYAFMISLIDFFGLGWVPELFLQKRSDRGFDWDLPAMRKFLDFSRRVLDLDLPDLHYVELLDEKEEGPHFSYTYSRDLETGKIWRQACTWTSYYSDGYTFFRPQIVE